MKKLLILLISILISFNSYSETKYNYYSNGEIKSEQNYKNGKKDGKWTKWHMNGQIKSEANYIDGKIEGKMTWWYESGEIHSETNYKDGKQEGKKILWYPKGKKWYEFNYKDGKKEGKSFEWHMNGQKSRETNYKDDEQNGRDTFWDRNGQIEYEENYKDGKQDGKQTIWDGNGLKWFEENYKDGKLDGKSIEWHQNGQIKSVKIYKEGKEIGFEKRIAEDETKKPEKAVDDDKVYSAASGSGFAVTSDGYVVTNYHVIEGCTDVKIHDKGKTILATLVTFDPINDVALIKGDFKPRSFYPLSRKNPQLLMDIYAAGYPFGQDMSTSVKVTQGIISSLTGIANNFSNIQIDAALQPGNSGGPIMNDKGNVIAVAVAKLDLEKIVDDYGVVPENVNFGVKSNLVINILESENIKLPRPNTKTIPRSELVELITDGTYYLSCWMTLAQIEKMIEKKVMFKDLK